MGVIIGMESAILGDNSVGHFYYYARSEIWVEQNGYEVVETAVI
ncbi:MAG TPA: hypothetical protein VJ183_20325 [Chloroflexia bacterium]|nr:hypothetical protein [Chloroflexia bacterium]